MRYFVLILFFALISTNVTASESLVYEVNGQKYEGYFVSPKPDAPLVLLIHDWDGLTEYEMKRAQMLSELGYAVFAADLFGAGIRPTEVVDKKTAYWRVVQGQAENAQSDLWCSQCCKSPGS